MVKHDENKDLRSVSKIGKVNYADNSITLNRNSIIGIKMWGKLDFLRNYRGYRIFWDNKLVVNSRTNIDDDKPTTTKERIKKHNKMK